jgi:AraC-like DNA-binding protein
MFTMVPPPHNAERVRSDYPDEVTSWAMRRDGFHSRVAHGSGPYGFEAATLQGERVWLGWARTRLRHTLRACAQWHMVHVPVDVPQRYVFGRQEVDVPTGAMAFIAPGAEVTRHCGPGALLAMDVDGDALAAEAQARRPGSGQPWSQFPQAFEPAEPLWRALGDAISALVRAHDSQVSPADRKHMESRVIAVIADVLLQRTDRTWAGRLTLQRIADLEAWIDAHLAEPITMGRLCEVAQVGERSVQLAFRARRGMSPMRFVCERRLAAAHRRILDAAADDAITGIATGLGFTHLGRFSLAYRELFGESPSQTRRRNQQQRRAAAVSISVRGSQ